MLNGSTPFKGQGMKELHSQIMKCEFEFKEELSENAKDLIKGLLKRKVKERLTVEEVLEHPWLKDSEKHLDIFNEGEKTVIRKEFTVYEEMQEDTL